MPRRLFLLVAVLALCGFCGCDDDRATPTASTASASAPAPTSFASVGGQPIPFISVLAYSRGGAAVHLLASTHLLRCTDLGGPFVREAGEITTEMTLAPLPKDGRWALTRVRLGPTTRQGDLGKVEPVAIDPRESVRVEIDAKSVVGAKGQELRLLGTIEAVGCGIVAAVRAKPRPQPNLGLSIDGFAVKTRGASYDADKHVLHLSTEPLDCARGLGDADLVLSLTLGDLPAVKRAKLGGFTIAHLATAKDPAFTVSPAVPADGEVTFDLSGKAKLGAHSVELGGSLVAQSCPAQ